MVSRFWNLRIWVPIALCSALIYSLYWLFKVVEKAYLNFPGFYFSNLITSFAQALHVIGLSLALISVYLVWGPQAKSFSDVKRKISVALLLEGLSYIILTPFILSTFIVSRLSYGVEAAVYGIYIVLVAPLLIILSFKVKSWSEGSTNENVLMWVGAASLGYIITIWVTIEVFWLDVILMLGLQYIMTGATYVIFLNSVFILSIALFFALLGIVPVIYKGRTDESTRKWCGLSLMLLGTHFIVFLGYTALTGTLSFALSIDIWIISFLGLGLSLLRKEPQKK